ncbi:MAG: C25 family cysteine peptidase [Saprospiraceae bacterium]|nr:C25 family cysteine peptidase [Saprospiraceae bacterium]
MKRIFQFFLLLCCTLVSAQSTHTWIHPEQKYYRIGIAEEGVYRITYDLLRQYGIPTADIPGDRFRLFHLGEEVPLYRSTSETFSPGDFLEFYGRPNRGELDSMLFEGGEGDMLNPHYSLFTDTSAYFLTWGSTATLLSYADGSVATDCASQPIPWVWQEQLLVFTDAWQKATYRVGQVGLRYSHFDHDGFASTMQSLHRIRLLPEKLVSTGPDAQLDIRLLSNDHPEGHQLDIRLNSSSLYTATFAGAQLRHISQSVSPSDLSSQPVLEIKGSQPQDRYAIGFVRLQYPAAAHAGKRSFWSFRVPATTQPQQLHVQDLHAPSRQWLLLDPNALLRYSGTIAAGKVELCLPPGTHKLPFLLYAPEHITLVSALSPVQFSDFSQLRSDFLLISHPVFMQPNGPAEAYAQYRSNRFQTLLVNVETLYDQFAYGIRHHPLAIRRFVEYLHKIHPLQYVLLLGKGLEYPLLRQASHLPAVAEKALIPTWGAPPSDNLLATDPGGLAPLVPIGRIAATEPQHVFRYLDKLRAFENNSHNIQTIAQQSWRKSILHLSGGGNATEQQLLRNYLSDIGRLLTHSTIGAEIFPAGQGSSFDSPAFFDQVNKGVALLTFLGHAAPGSFDANIDNPERYQNQGRYPFLLSLGCYSGNVFTPEQSLAERFCFLEQAGTIAFAATTGTGFLAPLVLLGREIYQQLGNDQYGKGLGDILRESIRKRSPDTDNILLKSLLEQFVLHGDPALQLHLSRDPDYTIDPQQFHTEPAYPTLLDDTIRICLEVYNLGAAISGDSLELELLLRHENNSLIRLPYGPFPAPPFREKICLPMATQNWLPGRRSLSLHILPRVQEGPLPAALQNNYLPNIFAFEVTRQNAWPLAPPDAAIFNHDTLHLQAFGLPSDSETTDLLFQLDTTPLFNSPLYQQQRLNIQAGQRSWKPHLSPMPGTSFFWRIALPHNQVTPVQSFTWIPGHPEGWRLQHPGQIQGGTFLQINASDWRFTDQYREIRLLSHPGQQHSFSADGQRWAGMWIWEVSPYTAGVQVLAMNPKDGEFLLNTSPGLYGSINHFQRWPLPTFAFDTTTPIGAKALAHFLKHTIPDGYHVLFYTGQQSPSDNYRPSQLAAAGVTELLRQQGASQVLQLSDTTAHPYLFFYRKGKEPIHEQSAPATDQPLVRTHRFPFSRTGGTYISPPAGPAATWSTLDIHLNNSDRSDRITLVLEEHSEAEKEPLLRKTLETDHTRIDLSFLHDRSIPFLRIKLLLEDSLHRTPPHIQSLQITYTGLPDVLFADPGILPDTLSEGERLTWQGTLANVGAQPSDSLRIAYRLSGSGQAATTGIHTYPPLAGNSQRQLSIDIPLSGLRYRQELSLAIHPTPQFPESNTRNNQWQGNFYIQPDREAPQVAAFIDGNPWRGKPVTGSSPNIHFVIRDDNLLLQPADTPAIQVLLQEPDGDFDMLPWTTDPDFRYQTDPRDPQTISLHWQPSLSQSGTHQLKLLVRDKSSGYPNLQSHIFTFEVMTQPTITECWNYPNPFSQQTHFVFALGGDQVVTNYRIQLFTVSGRFVRELSALDLGPIHPGVHPTPYPWDGTDRFGDPLAPGVYFYRVFIGNKQILLNKSPYFDKGIGKLVILR